MLCGRSCQRIARPDINTLSKAVGRPAPSSFGLGTLSFMKRAVASGGVLPVNAKYIVAHSA